MSEERTTENRNFDRGFHFDSFGVRIGIASSDRYLVGKARMTVQAAFGGAATIFEDKAGRADRVFGIEFDGGRFRLYKDGVETTSGDSERNFFKYLNSVLRLEVAEHVEKRVFVHAGVVGWRGRAIVIPGTSFAGKSTLTAELAKLGAEYYSDEYAVFDDAGHVAPFPRHLSLRSPEGLDEMDVPPESLGARVGKRRIPVGMVIFTEFSADANWHPQRLSAGEAVMELLPHTLSIRRNPAFCMKVLDLVTRRAIIVRSPRGEAGKYANFLLEFFENHSILT